MTPHELITARQAQFAAQRQYAMAHDRWAESEQVAKLAGHVEFEETSHQIARLVLRAWIAERDDPEPHA